MGDKFDHDKFVRDIMTPKERVTDSEGFVSYVPAQGWQPIETLPDDGSETIFRLFYNGEDVTVGVKRDEYSFDDALWIDRDGDMNRISPQPTHWMPLPAAPRSED